MHGIFLGCDVAAGGPVSRGGIMLVSLKIPLSIRVLSFVILATEAAGAATYFVDYTNGNDSYSFEQAQDMATPWRTWENFQGSKGASFAPGDEILFKRGETWLCSEFGEPFKPSAMDSVTFGAYGTGPRPVFDANTDAEGTKVMKIGHNGAATNLVFENIEFANSVPTTTKGNLVTAHIACHHLTFRNCHFDATNMNNTDYANLNETLSTDADYLVVDKCSFYGEPPYNRHAAYAGGR